MLRKLSRREKTVARLVARGMTNREIGDKLGVREGTVKIHVHHILTKLGKKNRMQVMRKMLRIDTVVRSRQHSRAGTSSPPVPCKVAESTGLEDVKE